MSEDDSERRAHERHPVRLEIEARSTQQETAARMTARNLSMGGLYCISPVGHAPMTGLEVRLLLPARDGADAAGLVLGATVVRCVERPEASAEERYELALLFTKLDADQRERLERHLTVDPTD